MVCNICTDKTAVAASPTNKPISPKPSTPLPHRPEGRPYSPPHPRNLHHKNCNLRDLKDHSQPTTAITEARTKKPPGDITEHSNLNPEDNRAQPDLARAKPPPHGGTPGPDNTRKSPAHPPNPHTPCPRPDRRREPGEPTNHPEPIPLNPCHHGARTRPHPNRVDLPAPGPAEART